VARNELHWRILTVSLLCATAVVILPFLRQLPSLNFRDLFAGTDQLAPALQRTVIFGLASSLVLTLFGFIGALVLRHVPSFSRTGKNLGVLILPVALGNISIAFIVKLLLGDSPVFSSIATGGVLYKLAFLALLQIWQFGFLFVYLFWLNFQTIPAKWIEYAVANKFSLLQAIKDIYIPYSKNLLLLLANIGFVFSLFEESKIQYLFKASRGTNSELVTNWLARNYQSSLLVNPGFAENSVFNAAGVVTLTAVMALAIVFVSINTGFSVVARLESYPLQSLFRFRKEPTWFGRRLCLGWAFLLIAVIVVPVAVCLTHIGLSFSTALLKLVFPLAMSLIATVTVSLAAILFGISSRLGWKNLLNSFSNRSLLFFLAMFLLMLAPPLIILVSGFKWMGLVGYRSEWLIYAIWIIGHTILTLPVLGSFVLFNHFRVSVNELDYLQVFKLKNRELIRLSFLSRFKAEYLFLVIIAFSFIWNEAILNNLFSDYIPSFAAGLKMLITGRGADYTQAFGYLFVSIMLAMAAVLVWRYIMERADTYLSAS